MTSNGEPIVADRTEFLAVLRSLRPLFCDIHGQTDAIRQFLLRNASICAPTDLWLARQLLSIHTATGVVNRLLANEEVDPHGSDLDGRELDFDLQFLASRGWLRRTASGYALPDHPAGRQVLTAFRDAPNVAGVDVFDHLVQARFSRFEDERVTPRFSFDFDHLAPAADGVPAWVAGPRELEIGFRLVPAVLALAVLGHTSELREGALLRATVPEVSREVEETLAAAAVIDPQGNVTSIGQRILERGTGPFGIIHSYRPYLEHRVERLRGEAAGLLVTRAENVIASRKANSKALAVANDAVDAFCDRTGYRYSVFIEHAFGEGEATRQRYARSGDDLQYVGADIDPVVTHRALTLAAQGVLPRSLVFLANTDIGRPGQLIAGLAERGCLPRGGVMVVGNGFHEIRNQTNERVVDVFRAYQEAGLIVVFIEETALSDEQLLATGWNTYHAGFRYVHQISGQGLRPHCDSDEPQALFSWRKCASLAGYRVLDEFSRESRRIAPCPSAPDNPPISATYFCVPKDLAIQLGL